MMNIFGSFLVAACLNNDLLGPRRTGPVGRAFIASRDEPEAARAFGIPVYRLRFYELR